MVTDRISIPRTSLARGAEALKRVAELDSEKYGRLTHAEQRGTLGEALLADIRRARAAAADLRRGAAVDA